MKISERENSIIEVDIVRMQARSILMELSETLSIGWIFNVIVIKHWLQALFLELLWSRTRSESKR